MGLLHLEQLLLDLRDDLLGLLHPEVVGTELHLDPPLGPLHDEGVLGGALSQEELDVALGVGPGESLVFVPVK